MSLVDYFKETRGELKHVSWPSRRQVVTYTAVVIILSILTGAYLGVLDYILGLGLDAFLIR